MFPWMLCFITNKKGAESSKLLNVFFHAVLLMRHDVRWIVWCLRDHYVALSSGFREHFPSCFPIHEHDDSAKTVPVRCFFWRACFWPLSSIATTSFDRIYPGSKYFIGSGFWPNFVSQCGVRRGSLTVSKQLDSCSTFQKAIVPSRVYPHILFLGSMFWTLPRRIHPIWNRGRQWKCWCMPHVFSWTHWFITNKKGVESSTFRIMFIHAPLLMRAEARWYFPGLCGVPETTIWHSRQASANTFPPVSLFTKDDDRAKTVPVECLLDGHVFGLFVPLPAPFLIGFTQEANISLEAGFGLIMFLSAVFAIFHSRY